MKQYEGAAYYNTAIPILPEDLCQNIIVPIISFGFIYVQTHTIEKKKFTYLSNKSTGTFINSSRKFPAVRTFFSPNMTLAHLNQQVKVLQCMGE